MDVLKPIPVEVHEPRPSPWNEIQTYLGPLVGPVGTAGMVLVFVIFMLLEREDLRDRLIRLVGANDLHRTTVAGATGCSDTRRGWATGVRGTDAAVGSTRPATAPRGRHR